MNAKLAGRVAVITGSTGGIGEGIARGLAADGAAVVISGRRRDMGEQIAHDIGSGGGRACFVQADLTLQTDCEDLIQAAVGRFGHIDILVNNAGIFPQVALEETSTELWDEVFAINVRAPFLCSRAAISPMRAQGGGSIINIGSTTVYRGSRHRLAYISSKGALLAMTKGLARDLLADRIRVNWITVGWVATPGEITLRDRIEGDGRAFLQERAEQAPLGRLETVEDIAAGVAYLASDEASHVTGCELNISGGLWI